MRHARLLVLVLVASCKPQPTDLCADVTCSGHGRCAVAGGTPLCVCDDGFRASALTCEAIAVNDPCAGVDCQTGGRCAVSMNAPYCVCGPGFHSIGTTECAPDAADGCAGVACSGHGVCAVAGTMPLCVCDDGFRANALACDAIVVSDPCSGVDCAAGGRCAVSMAAPFCVCGPGFHALGTTQCVPDAADPCANQACSGHGTCAVASGAALCVCDSGYHPSGMTCVADVFDAECQGVDCSMRGTCVVIDGATRTPLCQCDAGFHLMGTTSCVADPTDPCANQTCSGQGTCAVAAGAALCVCGVGFHASGLSCVADMMGVECQGVTCSSLGTCVVVEGNPRTPLCVCNAGAHSTGTTTCAPGPAEGGTCGNGFLEIHGPGTADDEQCDNGTASDSATCDSDCTIPVCGDNHVNAPRGEACDPGTVGGSSASCDSDCTAPVCGDGRVNPNFIPSGSTTGEECDDGNFSDNDACTTSCRLTRCGDGVRSGAEVCDTAGNSSSCDVDCTTPVCGDGITNTAAGEQCDDLGTVSGDGCSSACALEPHSLSVVKTGSGVGTVSGAGITCGADCVELFPTGGMVTLSAAPAAMSVFTGWSGACSGTAPCTLSMSSSRIATAQFDLNQLTIVRAGDGSGTVSGSGIACGADCTENYNVGTMVTLGASPSPGSTFTGWSVPTCPGTGPCVITMSGARSVTATFVRSTVTLSTFLAGSGTGTVTSGPIGISCPGDCNESIASGTQMTLFASPAAGSTFVGWSGAVGCVGTAPCVVTPSMSTTVTATFNANSYTLSVVKAGAGAGTVTGGTISCGSTCSQTSPYNTVVTLTAMPTPNSTFGGWQGGGCSGTGSCVVTLTQSELVVATFPLVQRQLTVTKTGPSAGMATVTSQPLGVNCGAICQAPFDDGTVVVLTVSPGAATFLGWTGACASAGTSLQCVLTMNAARTATANFN